MQAPRPPRHEEPDDPVEVRFPKDGLLALFIGLLNRSPSSGSTIGLTLFLPTGILTGDAINVADYMRETEGVIHAAFGELNEDTTAALAGFFRGIGQTHLADMREEAAHNKEPQWFDAEYIHLRNAQMVSGTQFIPTAGCLARIRIRDVNGFFFGRLPQTLHSLRDVAT